MIKQVILDWKPVSPGQDAGSGSIADQHMLEKSCGDEDPGKTGCAGRDRRGQEQG